MSRIVPVYIADVDGALLTYTQVRLYTDTSPSGAFSTLVDTQTLVGDVYTDPTSSAVHTYYMVASAATADTWFAWRLYNTVGPVSGDLSSPFQLLGVTLEEVRRLAAQYAQAGFASTCSADGGLSALTDAVLMDSGLSATFLNASWIDRYPVVTSDRIRRMAEAGFDPTTGSLIPLRPWADAPDSGDPYAVYAILPPIAQAGIAYSWDDAIRDGLKDCWFNDEVIIVNTVTEDDSQQNQVTLDNVPWLQEDRIRAIWARRIDSTGRLWQRNLTKNGSFWDIRDIGFGRKILVLSSFVAAGDSIVASVTRQPDPPYADTDIVQVDSRLAAYAAVMEAFKYLDRTPPTSGQYTRQVAGATREWMKLYAPYRPKDAIINA